MLLTNVIATHRAIRSRVVTIVASLVIVAGAGFAAHQQLFSSFADYDDEGYVLMSLRQFMAGQPLYDAVFTQYGPGFFVTQSAWHRLTNLPVTSDVARWKTLAAWLLTTSLAAAFVWRMTRHRALTTLAFLLAYFHFDRLGLEPGHPQDLCAPILAAMLWLATFAEHPRRALFVHALLGALVGLLVTTKLNLGLFAGLACALASFNLARTNLSLANPADNLAISAAHGISRAPSNKLIGVGLVAGAVALPFVLLREQAWTWQGHRLPMAVIAGVAGMLIAARRQNLGKTRSVSEVSSTSISLTLWIGIVTALALLWGVFLSGTSLAGLWWGMIGQHGGFAKQFYQHPPLLPWTAAWCVIAIGLSVIGSASRQRLEFKTPATQRLALGMASGVLVVIGGRDFVESFSAIPHGMCDRGWAAGLASLVTPCAGWLLLNATSRCFARKLLGWSVVLQPLGAIPAPGTQLAVGTLPALLALFVFVGDIPRLLRGSARLPRRRWQSIWIPTMLVLTFATLLCRCGVNWNRRSNYEPLNLAGAEQLRRPPEEVHELRTVLTALRQNADTFVTLPRSYNSFYLWSQLPPPTSFNATVWEFQLDDDHQHAIVAALQSANEPRLVKFRDRPPSDRGEGILLRYLRDHFTELERAGKIEIWKRPSPSAVNVPPSGETAQTGR